MEKSILTENLKNNISLISSKIPSNFNFVKRDLVLKGNIKCTLLYINGLANQDYIEQGIIYPLLFKIEENLENNINLPKYISERYISCYDCKIVKELLTICYSLKHGKCVILIDNNDSCLICNTTGGSYRNITISNIENTIKGGKDSFIESLEINLALLQQRFKNDYFKIENYVLGIDSQKDVLLMYVDNIVDHKLLNQIREKLKSISLPYLGSVDYIAQCFQTTKLNILPQSKTTEKPDKVVSDLLHGKVAIMMDGCPQVLIVPAVFIEFFQSVEDYSDELPLANFIRILRILATFIVLTISPVYLTLLEYNAALLPLPLIKILINSRLGIPLSPFLEVLSMELIIEFLREGGLRLPFPIGQTLGIVGGIVLGEAATKAGLVSNVTLVIVSINVISTFIIPNYDATLSIRFLRFPLLILTKLFGFLGLILGLYFLFLHLISMDSFGIPYFTPFAPIRGSHLEDSAIRGPLNDLNKGQNLFKFTKNKGNKNE
ncbi:spore germination protein [Clostridium brassicae]|uniref:Spore germination protein n=1 Tax=Clostridium brassicae TaxID=2999072 RepID=A0ABT4D8M2_9CLOT|nr:spore germination protein [Clostridium brassicae]MCY6958659.1 spore germination protein [Clostridium brassicae]